MARWRQIAIGLTALLGVLALGRLLAGAWVARRVNQVMEARGGSGQVGAVAFHWFWFELEDVALSLPEEPAGDGASLRARVSRCRVETRGFRPVRVVAEGGAVELSGGVEALRRRIRGGTTKEGSSSSSLDLEASAFHLNWNGLLGPGSSVAARGVALQRVGGALSLAFEGLAMRSSNAEVNIAEAQLKRGADGRVTSLVAGSAVVTRRPAVVPPPTPRTSLGLGAPPDAGAPVDEPVALAVQRLASGKGAGGSWRMASLDVAPKVMELRGRLDGALGGVVPLLAPSAEIRVEQLSLRLAVGNQELSIGPGDLRVERGTDTLRVAFQTTASGGTPLQLDLRLPLGQAPGQGEVVATLAGGPVPLSVLRATVGGGTALAPEATLEGQGRFVLGPEGSLQAGVDLQVRGLTLEHPALAPGPVEQISLRLRGEGAAHRGEIALKDFDLTLGELRVRGSANLLQRDDHDEARIHVEVPTSGCQALLGSLPRGLVPALEGTRLGGTFGFVGDLVADSRRLDDLVLRYQTDDRCHFDVVPSALAREHLVDVFTYRAYRPDGTPLDRVTGPRTLGWVPFDAVSPYLEVAVLTTEDGGFRRHHGVDARALRGALIADVKAGRFVRGASTITMQLAKNLFLDREKHLSRKLQELVLTDYLEQTFSKEELLELYWNIVEFGPDIYGVGEASEHYFGRAPTELNVTESLFLATMLPSPTRLHFIYERKDPGGRWRRQLDTLTSVAGRVGLLSPQEVQSAKGETLEFWRPNDPRPTPRPPAAPDRRAPVVEAPWSEVN